MASCYLHKGKFANDGVCPKCKSCKHSHWFLADGTYKCSDCPKETTKLPSAGEIQELLDGKWKQIRP